MPKRKGKRVEPGDLPSTIARSDKQAQRLWKETHDSAIETCGEGERAHRTACASLQHSCEKVGDHWEKKARKGPSDPRAREPTQAARVGKGETFGGINYPGHARKEFLHRARKVGIKGRSKMDKRELAEAIEKRKHSQEAREGAERRGRRKAA